jgi:flagellar secretion chaperone FliS
MLTGLERYKSVQIKTSSPGEVLMMLFDGMFKFIDEAIDALGRDDRARAGERIGRAHAILTELSASLNRAAAPELCENLEAVYFFSMSKLLEANLHRDVSRLEDVKRILEPVRDGFRIAVVESSRERGAA